MRATPLTRTERDNRLSTFERYGEGATIVSVGTMRRYEATVQDAEDRVARLREFIEELDCECDGSPDGPGRCSRCTVLAMNGGPQ